ncbi:MAG TPA: tripartite tricarboxylate transporter substrate-binding protein [Burkholderiales bacterium]|nr:tripartite tricarboxylate transporter substrate-binding protein [Burkholderiales bacterium]
MPIRFLSKLVVLVVALCCGTAAAQTFPARPLKILVPSVAGSSPDIRARQIAGKLAETFGQPVIVENRTGANGLIAAREAAKAPPDGHTLFLALINNAVTDAINPDPCCRLGSELIPVSRFSMTPYLWLVNAEVPAQTLQEFIALARAKPETVTLASHGPGSLPNLLGAWLKNEGGVRLLEVPYKGVNSEIPDLQSGQVMSAFVVPQVVLGPLKAGKLRALAVTTRERLAILPDVPTTAEAGLPGLEAIVWNGIFVPAGTPASVVERLHRELVRAYNAPEVREQLRAGGSYAAADTPEEFAAFVRSEKEKWGRLGREAGIKAQ